MLAGWVFSTSTIRLRCSILALVSIATLVSALGLLLVPLLLLRRRHLSALVLLLLLWIALLVRLSHSGATVASWRLPVTTWLS